MDNNIEEIQFIEVSADNKFMLEFMEMMRRNVSELIKESCEVACAVFYMYFIEEMSLKEISEELDVKESFIDMYVKYYDKLLR